MSTSTDGRSETRILTEADVEALRGQAELLTSYMTARLLSLSSASTLVFAVVAAGSAIGLQNGDAFLFIAPAVWTVLALLVQQLADLGCAAEARRHVHSVLAQVSPYYQMSTAAEAARSSQYRSPWTRIAMVVVLVAAASAASFLGFREVSTGTLMFWGYSFALLVSFAMFVLSVKEGSEVNKHLGDAYRSLGLHDVDGDD